MKIPGLAAMVNRDESLQYFRAYEMNSFLYEKKVDIYPTRSVIWSGPKNKSILNMLHLHSFSTSYPEHFAATMEGRRKWSPRISECFDMIIFVAFVPFPLFNLLTWIINYIQRSADLLV